MAADIEAFMKAPRRRRLMLWAAALAAIIAVGIWAWPRPHVMFDVPLNIQVLRNEHWYDLTAVAPLSDQDRLLVQSDIPDGLYAALVSFDSQGRLRVLATLSASDPTRVLQYPPAGQLAPMTSLTGTELVLVCVRRSKAITEQELKDLWPRDVTWPTLPDDSVLKLTGKGVDVLAKSRGIGDVDPRDPHADPVSTVCQDLEKLRQSLRRANIDSETGIAVGHQKSP